MWMGCHWNAWFGLLIIDSSRYQGFLSAAAYVMAIHLHTMFLRDGLSFVHIH